MSVTVIDDGSPLQLLTNTGPVSAVGLSARAPTPTSPATARVLVAAKLNYFSNLGEGGPIGMSLASTQNNSGADLYGSRAPVSAAALHQRRLLPGRHRQSAAR